MPVGDVLVSDSGGDIKHDDAALAVDIVSVSQTAELFLTCGIPYVELNLTQVLPLTLADRSIWSLPNETYRSKAQRVDFDTQCGNILLFEFTGQMSLDEGCLKSGLVCLTWH